MLQEICVLGRSSCELNYTCVHLCPPKNRHQDRVRNVSNLLLKYLWWIKKRKKEKVERASSQFRPKSESRWRQRRRFDKELYPTAQFNGNFDSSDRESARQSWPLGKTCISLAWVLYIPPSSLISRKQPKETVALA